MNTKKQNDYEFVTEQTKKVPINKKSKAKSIVWVVVLAAIFGVVAALVFSVMQPLFSKKADSQVQDEVSLSENEAEPSAPEETTEPVEPIYITETQTMEPEDYQVLQSKLYNIGLQASNSVVAVTGVKSATDWFDADYESRGQGSGIIIAETDTDLMIVTEKSLITDVNQIQVTFNDGNTAAATMIGYDGDTGIAALSVAKSDLSESTLSIAVPAELGSSIAVSQGAMVLAIGSPYGETFSILTGNVVSTGKEINTLDANYSVLGTDIEVPANAGGALINLNGQVIGLITHGYGMSKESGMLEVLGISDLRNLIEHLTNGNNMAYLGVQISTVTSDISQQYSVPEGVYITNVNVDSPAMTSGLQVGDVIIDINGTAVSTVDAFETQMLKLSEGQTVKVTVQRMGAADTYQEVTCDVTLSVLN